MTTESVKQESDALMAKLYSMEASKDLTIVAGNGTEVKCHKMVFERIFLNHLPSKDKVFSYFMAI